MKLPDFTDDQQFNTLRQLIGATLSVYMAKLSLPSPVYKETKATEQISLPELGIEIEGLGDLKINSDQTLTYDGRRVTVHIRDVQNIGGRNHTPRFHVSNCRTLPDMRARGRFERYVVSDRDDGFFYIRHESRELNKTRLDVCQNCLDRLAWDNFSSESSRAVRQNIVAQFSLTRFFARYPRTLFSQLPKYSVDSAPVNDYPNNWEEISLELRRQLRFTCQNCGLQLEGLKTRFLHIHHLNGLKYDTSPNNLRCLCLYCHANQPGHSHMKALPDYADFLSLSRK